MTSFTDIKILLCPSAIYIRPPIGPNGCHPISLALPTVLLMLEKAINTWPLLYRQHTVYTVDHTPKLWVKCFVLTWTSSLNCSAFWLLFYASAVWICGLCSNSLEPWIKTIQYDRFFFSLLVKMERWCNMQYSSTIWVIVSFACWLFSLGYIIVTF